MNRILDFISHYWLALTLLCFTAITVLSLWPAESLPSVPGTDKTHHLIAYACLVFPAALSKPKHWLLIALLFISWSGIIELVQPYVNRYGEWLDMLANVAGIACGVIIATLLNRWRAD